MPISGPEVDSWIDEMSHLASQFVARFEVTYGFPPDEHYVSRVADSGGRNALATALGGAVARDLVDFYSRVAQVSLPDVGPGFFVDEAECVVEGLRGAQPTQVSSVSNRTIVVFGSDGGGALFAADCQTGEIVRLDGGSLVGNIYEAAESGVQVIARDVEGFMQFLYREMLRQTPADD
ncbi:hypothetical protein [Streptomyces albidoflavus]|uniref:hypothetical protein n=1 Tax=Streptomyces albidoflavus TaxID=1886 RepID=UPI003410B6C0